MFEYKKPNCINSLYTDVCLKQPMHGNSKKKKNKQTTTTNRNSSKCYKGTSNVQDEKKQGFKLKNNLVSARNNSDKISNQIAPANFGLK